MNVIRHGVQQNNKLIEIKNNFSLSSFLRPHPKASERIHTHTHFVIVAWMSAPDEQKPGATSTAAPKKMCCVCPETKKLRDECVLQNGEDLCAEAIERHKECLRKEGFRV
jgi:cytochrome c oxidase assembly protein subunit 17